MLLNKYTEIKISGSGMKFIITLIFLSCMTHSVVRSQILKDSTEIRRIKQCIGYIYNFRFTEGEEICNQLSASYKENPVTPLIRGMIIYWQNYPLLPDSEARNSFEAELHKSIDICESKEHNGDEVEYLLANLCARGLLLLFYSDNDINKEVFGLAGSTYRLIRQSFHYTDVYPDLYFFTGLYNYYREKYPELYPIYKPLALFFPRGDSDKGLKELQTAAKESIFLSAEASDFLAWIYAVYENDFNKSMGFSMSLHEKYPDNISYQADYIKSLLLDKKYAEAEKLVSEFGNKSGNSYFQAQLSVFNGIIQEKKYRNIKMAVQYYDTGLKSLTLLGAYGNEYAAYACFGLSRFYNSEKSADLTKKYRKMAINLSESRKINFDN